MMSKKRRSRENAEAATTAKRVRGERNDNRLWRLVTDHPDIFDTHIVPKLTGNDVKFFYGVNSESRMALKRSGAHLPDAFKIGDFATKSTLSWALEKCSEKKERFCAEMAMNGSLELLKFLLDNGCPWGKEVAQIAKDEGTPYEYLFALYNSKMDDGYLKKSLRPGIEVIAKVLRDRNATVPNIELACTLVVLDLLKSEPDEELVCRALELNLCEAFQLKAENAKSKTIMSLSIEIRELLNRAHKEKKASNKAVSRSSKPEKEKPKPKPKPKKKSKSY